MNKKKYYIDEIRNRKFKKIIEQFQDSIINETTYFGVKTQKNPIDYWIYQEIIFSQKPDFIIEIGNLFGGSTLALAHICDNLNHGQIIGIDIDHSHIQDTVKKHNRIQFLTGDATALVKEVESITENSKNILIIEDSSHTFDNTLKVLELYSHLIPLGGYFIIEDTICHHGLNVGPDPGPYEAVEEFLKNRKDFESDRSKERFTVSWNPNGFLRRIK